MEKATRDFSKATKREKKKKKNRQTNLLIFGNEKATTIDSHIFAEWYVYFWISQFFRCHVPVGKFSTWCRIENATCLGGGVGDRNADFIYEFFSYFDFQCIMWMFSSTNYRQHSSSQHTLPPPRSQLLFQSLPTKCIMPQVYCPSCTD